jgi:hypothetical protein
MFTVILRVVCVVDHRYVFAEVEVNATLGCDAESVAEPFSEITGVFGAVNSEIVLFTDVAKHAGPPYALTEYVPAPATTTERVVAPFDQR